MSLAEPVMTINFILMHKSASRNLAKSELHCRLVILYEQLTVCVCVYIYVYIYIHIYIYVYIFNFWVAIQTVVVDIWKAHHEFANK
jgi:hypothetical protein